MNESGLKLTTYFGERQRAAGQLLADVLLELYGQHRIATSLLLRGAEGFGLRHQLRTDRLLTLSEDLPLTAVAVDTSERIHALLAELRRIDHRGLTTLERVRLLRGTITAPTAVPETCKLTVYVGRRQRVGRAPAHVAVCALLHRRGLAGASVMLGVDGTHHGQRARARMIGRNADVPIMVIAVGDGERIAALLPELSALLPRPLLTLERVALCKHGGRLLTPPPSVPASDRDGLALWQKLTVFSSERARHDGAPVHQGVVRGLRADGAAGATALRGIWGFHGDRPPHGDRLLQLGRGVPVLTTVIDTPQRIGRAFAVIDEVTAEHGVVFSEVVPAMRVVTERQRRGGLELAWPEA